MARLTKSVKKEGIIFLGIRSLDLDFLTSVLISNGFDEVDIHLIILSLNVTDQYISKVGLTTLIRRFHHDSITNEVL